jgi:hypothetical protein
MAYFPYPTPPARQPMPTYAPPAASKPEGFDRPGILALMSTGLGLMGGQDIGAAGMNGLNVMLQQRNALRQQQAAEEERAYNRHRDAVGDTRFENTEARSIYQDDRDFSANRGDRAEDVDWRTQRAGVEDSQWAAGHGLDRDRFGQQVREYNEAAGQRAADLDNTLAQSDYYRHGGRGGAGLDVGPGDVKAWRESLGARLGIPDGESLIAQLGPDRLAAGELEFGRVYQATRDAAQADAAARAAMGLPQDAQYEDPYGLLPNAGIYGTPVGGKRGILGDFAPQGVPTPPPSGGGMSAQAAETVDIDGVRVEVIERLPDGRVKVRDPKTGRTGTVIP